MTLTEAYLRQQFGGHAPKRHPVTERTRLAAVAAVLRYASDANDPEILLIRRTSHPQDPWSGHMAFPGGRHDEGDRDLIHTAVRETQEEVGLDLETRGDYLGRLDDVQAISKARPMDLIIVPHVFVIEGEAELTLDQSEVAEALWAPTQPMIRGEIDTVRPYDRDGVNLKLPGYQVGPHIVWGLTYRMLQLLFDLAR